MADRTLYASSDRKRFFHVPDDARLPPGDFVVRSLSGEKLVTDPVALGVYEVPEAEAMAIAQASLGKLADKVRAITMSAAKALSAPPALDPAAAEARKARVAESLRVGRETLTQDPAALGAALKGALDGLIQAARETVHDPEAARERMKDVAEALRQEGAPSSTADALEALPDRLREVLASGETVARLEAAAADLRKASAEIRAEMAEKNEPLDN